MSYPRTLAEEGIKILRHHEKAYQIPVRQVQWGGVLNRIDEMGRYIYDETVAMADECCTLAWPKDTRETSGFANAWPAMLEETGGGSSSSPGGGQQGNAAGFTFSGVNTNFSQGSAGINNFGGVRQNFSNGGPGINNFAGGGAAGNNPASPGSFGGQAGMNVHIDPDPPGGASAPGGGNGPVATPGTPPKSHCGTMSGKHTMVPILDDGWGPDKRFKGLQVQFPDNFPKMPKGVYGIAIAGTTEYEQKNLFFPTEARLFAVNFEGDPKMGSLVCDLDKDFKIDKNRTAPLQSAFRVLKKPLGNDNAIAIQLGPSGCQDTAGGYVYDVGQPAGTGPAGSGAGSTQTGELPWVIAQLSVNKGGFIDVGSEDDKHNNGADDDKTKINKAHISTKALFRRNKVEDGPLRFEKVYKPGTELDQVVNVHLAWAGGDWAWWTTSPLIPVIVPNTPSWPTGTIKDGGNPTGGYTNYPFNPGNLTVGVTTGNTVNPGTTTNGSIVSNPLPGASSGPSNPGPGNAPPPGSVSSPEEVPPSGPPSLDDIPGILRGWVASVANVASTQPVVSPFATTAMNGFVQGFMTSRSAVATTMTLAQATSWGAAGASTGKNNLSSPVSGAMSAFGAQGGQSAAAGSFPALFAGAAGDPWNYTTNPGSSRFPTGTSSGGWVIHPPETTPADQEAYGMIPPRATLSTTYFMTAPGAWFGSGTPQLAIGGITSGWSWGMDTTNGDLLWRSHVNGTPTNGIRFVNATQNIAWYSGTSFTGTLDHSNSQNRLYTFVDMSAQVELFQVGGGNPNAMFSGVIGTLFWDNANFALWVNSDNATTWKQVTGAPGAAGATGATGATGAAGTEVIVTLPGTSGAVAGYGFQPYGLVYTGGAYTPPGVMTGIPGTILTFTLTTTQTVLVSYSLTWSGISLLPDCTSGLIIDGTTYILSKDALGLGGGMTGVAFGHTGTISLVLTAGGHSVQPCASQTGAGPVPLAVNSSAASPTTVSVLVPTTLSVLVPPVVVPDNVNALLNVGYLTTDVVAQTNFARTLAFDGNVVGTDTGPGNPFVFGLNPVGVTISTLTLTNPLATTGGGTGLATIGSALQTLRVNAAGTGLEYATAGSASPLTTKGDIFGYDVANARIPVGADTFVLTADSTQALGVKWAAGGAGTVTASGPPIAAQVAYWTSATDITGDPGMTYNAATDRLSVAGQVLGPGAFSLTNPDFSFTGALSTGMTGGVSAAGGEVNLVANGVQMFVVGWDGTTPQFEFITPASSSTQQAFLFEPGAITNAAAGSEISTYQFNFQNIHRQTGAVTTQREVLFSAPTYSFVAASTIATAATVAISGAPIPGAFATLSATYALWVQSGVSLLTTLNLTNPLTYLYGGTGLAALGTAGQALVVNAAGTAIEWGTVAAAASSTTTTGVDSYVTVEASSTSPLSRQLRFDPLMFTVVDAGPGGVYYVTGVPVAATVVNNTTTVAAPVTAVIDPLFAGPGKTGWVPDPVFSTSQRFLADNGTWSSPSLLIVPGGSLDPLARILQFDGGAFTTVDSGPGNPYFVTLNSNFVLSGKTPGSVLFVGQDNTLSENNGSFFWDNTNGRFILGTDKTMRIQSSVGQPFVFKTDFSTNTGTNNPTLIIGYNCTGLLSNADNRISGALPAQSIEMEADYNSGATRQMEWNHNYRSSTGVYRRGFVYTCDNTTLVQAWQWRAASYSWVDDTAVTNYMALNSTGLVIGAAAPATKLEIVSSGLPQVRISDSQGVIYTNLFTDASGYFIINPTGAASRFQASSLRVEGSTAIATGAGLELGYNTGTTTGTILAFDRTGAAYKPLSLDSSALNLNTNNTGLITCGGQLSLADAGVKWTSEATSNFGRAAAGIFRWTVIGNPILDITANGLTIYQAGGGSYSFLTSDAADNLALKNGANAQTFRVYGAAGVYGQIKHDGTNFLLTQSGGNQIAFGTAAMATNATTGFRCIPGGAGPPTGTPTNIPTGQLPEYFDTTNLKHYVYVGGTWKKGQVTLVDVIYA